MAESEEKMYHSRKSDVLDCLQKEIEARLSSIELQESPPHFDSIVIDDGGALINSLVLRVGAITFENYLIKHFLQHIEMQLQMTERLDIVWNAYWESSIKGETRNDRSIGACLKIGPNVKLPKNWTVSAPSD